MYLNIQTNTRPGQKYFGLLLFVIYLTIYDPELGITLRMGTKIIDKKFGSFETVNTTVVKAVYILMTHLTLRRNKNTL